MAQRGFIASARGATKGILGLGALGIVGGIGLWLLIKNAPNIGNAVGAVAGQLGSSLLGGIQGAFNSILNPLPAGAAPGSSNTGGIAGTQYTITDPTTGKTTVYRVPLGSNPPDVANPNPALNLINPITGQPQNLASFQTQFPDLYKAISQINLPSTYEQQYISGKINTQPIDYTTAVLNNIQQFQANIALGANPQTGEFTTHTYRINPTAPPVPLTPYELAYYASIGVHPILVT